VPQLPFGGFTAEVPTRARGRGQRQATAADFAPAVGRDVDIIPDPGVGGAIAQSGEVLQRVGDSTVRQSILQTQEVIRDTGERTGLARQAQADFAAQARAFERQRADAERQRAALQERLEAQQQALADQRAKDEARQIELRATQLNGQFSAAMAEALRTGADFDPIREQFLDAFDQLSESIDTRGGLAALELARAQFDAKALNETITATAAREGERVKSFVDQKLGQETQAVLRDVDEFPAAVERIDAFIDSFDSIPAQDREAAKLSAREDLGAAAAEALLLQDPRSLRELLTEGEGIPGLDAAKAASFIGKADAEIARREKAANALTGAQKLRVRQALREAAETRVLSNAEFPLWEQLGITPAQYDSDQQRSLRAAEKRQLAAAQEALVADGDGAVLEADDYQASVESIVQARTEGLEGAERDLAALDARIKLAGLNGRGDRSMTRVIDAAAVSSSQEQFLRGLSVRNRMQDAGLSELVNRAVSSDSRNIYDVFERLVTDTGLTLDQAFEHMSTLRERLPEVKQRLNDPDLKREIQDAAADLALEGDVVSQTPFFRQEITRRAQTFLAINNFMTATQAVELARDRIEADTFETDQGIRAPRGSFPELWSEAQQFARQNVLKDVIREQLGQELDRDELNSLFIVPRREGDRFLAQVVDPRTGVVMLSRWDLADAKQRWWNAEGKAAHTDAVLEAEAINAALQRGFGAVDVFGRLEGEAEPAGLEAFRAFTRETAERRERGAPAAPPGPPGAADVFSSLEQR